MTNFIWRGWHILAMGLACWAVIVLAVWAVL